MNNTWLFTNTNTIAIPEGADIKSEAYLNIGGYVCHSDNTAKTLINCPTETGFVLYVYKSLGMNASYIGQLFVLYDGRAVFKRYYNGYDNYWGVDYEYVGSVAI